MKNLSTLIFLCVTARYLYMVIFCQKNFEQFRRNLVYATAFAVNAILVGAVSGLPYPDVYFGAQIAVLVLVSVWEWRRRNPRPSVRLQDAGTTGGEPATHVAIARPAKFLARLQLLDDFSLEWAHRHPRAVLASAVGVYVTLSVSSMIWVGLESGLALLIPVVIGLVAALREQLRKRT